MLQNELVKRIERINRMRLFYAAHLALYGVLLAGCGLIAVVAPAHWQTGALALLLWLPLMLGHTALQTLYEARERCITEYQLAPAKAMPQALLPVDLYDEDGNLLGSGDQFTLLPPPRI